MATEEEGDEEPAQDDAEDVVAARDHHEERIGEILGLKEAGTLES